MTDKTKQKATDRELGELHSLLARSMKDALQSSDEAKSILEACHESGEELPPFVEAFLEKAATANPALLTAVAKFLKDNNITAAVEDSEEMSDLQKRLKDKRRHSVDNVVPITEDFG